MPPVVLSVLRMILKVVEAAPEKILTRSGVEMDSLDEGTGRLDEQLGVVRNRLIVLFVSMFQ